MKLFQLVIAVLIFTAWMAPAAHAIVMACPDGTWVGPLFLSPDPCVGHRGNKPPPAPPPQPQDVSFAVDFKFHDRKSCVGNLKWGLKHADASVQLEGHTIEEYCEKLFPGGIQSGDLHPTLNVTFHLQDFEQCVEVLTKKMEQAKGKVRFENSDDAEAFCKRTYPTTQTATRSEDPPAGENHPPKPKSCVVQRSCGDLEIPHGQAVAGFCAAVCTRELCKDGELVKAGICMVDGGCQFAFPNGKNWCQGDPLTR